MLKFMNSERNLIMQSRLIALALMFCLSACGGQATQSPSSPSTPQDLSKIAGWRGAAPRSPEAFSFVVTSDLYGGAVPGKWPAAVRQINLLQPEFIMSIGDLIDGYGADEAELNRQWDEFDAMTAKFDAPFFYTPGNHDIKTKGMQDVYLKRYGWHGRTHYSFDYRGCHFIVLDSASSLTIKGFHEKQLAWLADDLAAAKDAKHIFIFLHHPPLEIAKVWPGVAEKLPRGKTTVFCGHFHSLRYKDAEGIPVYVLSSTASGEVKARQEGLYRMFAHVTVGEGEPTIAFVPVDELRPAWYAAFSTKVKSLGAIAPLHLGLPATGGIVPFSQENPLDAPITASLSWQAEQWTVSPPTAEFTIEPGQVAEQSFSLAPAGEKPTNPILTVTYKLTDAYTGEQVESVRKSTVGTFARLEVPTGKGLVVDGETNDLAASQPLVVRTANKVARGKKQWTGPDDASYELRVAREGGRLFVAISVTDDDLRSDSNKWWMSDSVVFSWDCRPADKRTGSHGDGTGRLTLPITTDSDNDQPKPHWFTSNIDKPKGLDAVCKRRPGGYVYEFSIPLTELAEKMKDQVGQEILIEIQLNDMDGESGPLTRMSSSGRSSRHATASYIRCVLR